MEVRRLSPDSLWIEMPLSAQTCLFVWNAMAGGGLRNGKINSYREEHFSSLYAWQDHLIEGRTAQGLFDPKATIQVKLTVQECGTLLTFTSANSKHDFDFGSAFRERRRLVPCIEHILRDAPLDWEEEREADAPIASPYGGGPASPRVTPSFELVTPLTSLRWSVKNWGCLASILLGGLVSYWQLWGVVFLGIAAWEVWRWQTRQRKWAWGSFALFLFYSTIGIYNLLPLIKRWF